MNKSAPKRPPAVNLSRYALIQQFSAEFIGCALVGWLIDYGLGTTPWICIGLATLGLIGAMIHLIQRIKIQ